MLRLRPGTFCNEGVKAGRMHTTRYTGLEGGKTKSRELEKNFGEAARDLIG
jgi:hypothetical protein